VKITQVTYFFVSYSLLNSSILFVLPLMYKSKEEYDRMCKVLFSIKVNILLGFLCLISAVLVVFFPVSRILIIGDLIPLILLLVMSFFNLSEFIRQSRYLDKDMAQLGSKILTHIQIPLGIAGIVVSFLHILFSHYILL
jgi:hypothetical protein